MTATSRTRRLARGAAGLLLRHVGRLYVPGPALVDALACAEHLQAQGLSSTIGYFNADDEDAATVAAAGEATVAALAPWGAQRYVSVKAPSLGYDLDRLARIAAIAAQQRQCLHFDSHGPETAAPTLALIAALIDRLGTGAPPLGLSLPTRWRRSAADIEWALQRGVRLRLIKGQWADPSGAEADLRAGFLAAVDQVAGRVPTVALATHDAPLLRDALALLQAAGSACEVELLYGLPRREVQAVARSFGAPLRCYIPYGQAWMPHALGQAFKNPRVIWWTARDAVAALRPA